MRCPNCNSEVPEGKRFCGHCGHRLEPAADRFDDEAPTKLAPPRPDEVAPPRPEPMESIGEVPAAALKPEGLPCPACGAQNRLGAQFCDRCGAALEKAAPVDTPEELAVPAELPRPRAKAVLPLLAMVLGWAIPMAVAEELYSSYRWDLYWAYSMEDEISRAAFERSLVVPSILRGLLSGGLSGLVSGLALQWTALSLRTKHILAIAASWAAVWTVIRASEEFAFHVLPVFFNILILLASWSVGALSTALALQRAERALHRKHVLGIAAVWPLAILGGALVGMWFGESTKLPYLHGGAISWAFAGAAGYGIIQWQLGRAKASR